MRICRTGKGSGESMRKRVMRGARGARGVGRKHHRRGVGSRGWVTDEEESDEERERETCNNIKHINTQIKSTRVKANSDVEICSETLFSKTEHMIPMQFTFVYEFRE